MRIANAQVWVHDQDEALAFYTEKLGMEVRADTTLAEMGDFRWLTVGPARPGGHLDRADGDPGSACLRGRDGGPDRGADGQGRRGGVFLTTDDFHASYEELSARGVEFVETPQERPYGIDCGFRDPSGNNLRLTQVMMPANA